jgi:hypothetical protein
MFSMTWPVAYRIDKIGISGNTDLLHFVQLFLVDFICYALLQVNLAQRRWPFLCSRFHLGDNSDARIYGMRSLNFHLQIEAHKRAANDLFGEDLTSPHHLF